MTITDRFLEETGGSILGKDPLQLLQDSVVCHMTWNSVGHTVFEMVPKTNPGGVLGPGRSLTVACSCSPGFPCRARYLHLAPVVQRTVRCCERHSARPQPPDPWMPAMIRTLFEEEPIFAARVLPAITPTGEFQE